MIYQSCVITVIFLVVGTLAVSYTDCGSKEGRVTKVDIVGCETGSSCSLIRGGNATITIQFEAEKEASAITSIVHGIIQGMPVPFNFPYPDACAYGGLACPLTAQKAYIYTATLPIKRMYPKIHVKIQWQLQNEQSEDIVCVLIPVQIK